MRIKNYDELTNHGNTEGRKIVADIIEAGLSATNPYNNTLKLVSIKDNKLIFDCVDMEPKGDPRHGPAVYDLAKINRIFIFAIGKGILYIVKALEEALGSHLTGGLAIGKHGDDIITEKVEVILGNHPVQDEAGVNGCRRMMETIKSLNLKPDDLVITVMGNGCSALATLPMDGISLKDIQDMNQLCLIDTGMPTNDVSYLRNQVDQLRGGRILRAIRPAQIVNLIGVGPYALAPNTKYTTDYEHFLRANLWLPNKPDCTTTPEAIEIAKRWGVFEKLPESVRNTLLSNKEATTTLSYEEYESYDCRLFGVMPRTMGSFEAAVSKAKELGFTTHILTTGAVTEAAPTGRYIAILASYSSLNDGPFKPPCILIEGGELIVTVNGEPGIGGTNQEYCTAAISALDGNKRVVIAAVDTDGTDGPGGDFHPDAKAKGIRCLTGGIVDGYSAEEARKKGVDIFGALKTHGTSNALWEIGSGIAAVQDISLGDLHCILIMDHDG